MEMKNEEQEGGGTMVPDPRPSQLDQSQHAPNTEEGEREALSHYEGEDVLRTAHHEEEAGQASHHKGQEHVTEQETYQSGEVLQSARRRRVYSEESEEDQAIISYIVSQDMYQAVGEVELWVKMERHLDNTLPRAGRSWKGLRERFRRSILPLLESFTEHGLNPARVKEMKENFETVVNEEQEEARGEGAAATPLPPTTSSETVGEESEGKEGKKSSHNSQQAEKYASEIPVGANKVQEDQAPLEEDLNPLENAEEYWIPQGLQKAWLSDRENQMPQASLEENQMPQEEEQMPQEEEQMPQEENQMPQEENQMPQEEDQMPQEEDQMQQEEDQMPQEENQMPQEEDQMPQEENQMPQEENQMPQEENQMPQEENQMPQEEDQMSQEDLEEDQSSEEGQQNEWRIFLGTWLRNIEEPISDDENSPQDLEIYRHYCYHYKMEWEE
ncbi:golgin subfamily A member 6-like protein 7 [Scylla paramamosain]|uniref:golgin subfamily A member 6-like protein 7 n=1 Tax=Scylla paramamosain TaxID=85552 RepID=UPI003082848C